MVGKRESIEAQAAQLAISDRGTFGRRFVTAIAIAIIAIIATALREFNP